MSFPKPVPSRAALNALRGLVFTTWGSVVLLAEERRQRTKIARRAVENARKLHTLKARRNSVAHAGARVPDPDFDDTIDSDESSITGRRKRGKSPSEIRSKSANPPSTQTKKRRGRTDLEPPDAQESPHRRPKKYWRRPINSNPLKSGSFDHWDLPSWGHLQQMTRWYDEEYGPMSLPQDGNEVFTPVNNPRDTFRDEVSLGGKGRHFNNWLTRIWGTWEEMAAHYDEYDGQLRTGWPRLGGRPIHSLRLPRGYADNGDLNWASPSWGLQEDMAAHYNLAETRKLEPDDAEWGVPSESPLEGNASFPDCLVPDSGALPKEARMPALDQGPRPSKTNQELWSSEYSTGSEAQSTQARLYRIFRELHSNLSRNDMHISADDLARAKIYLLYAPHLVGGKHLNRGIDYWGRYAVESAQAASILINDLLSAAEKADTEDRLASDYLMLAVAMFRKFPKRRKVELPGGPEPAAMVSPMHPAGYETVKRLLQYATARDSELAPELFEIIFVSCQDKPGVVAELFQMYTEENDLAGVQWLLEHFTSQSSEEYGFFFDDAFFQEVLERHIQLFRQPEATSKVFTAVREANTPNYIHIPKTTSYDLHALLAQNALLRKAPEFCPPELNQLQKMDARRFANDTLMQNTWTVSDLLNATPEKFATSVESIDTLVPVSSETFKTVLADLANTCHQQLPPGRFMDIIWTMTEKHQLVMNDRWVRTGVEWHLRSAKPDFDALRSWLHYSQETGWSPDESFTTYANRRLDAYGPTRPKMSVLENLERIAFQVRPWTAAETKLREMDTNLLDDYDDMPTKSFNEVFCEPRFFGDIAQMDWDKDWTKSWERGWLGATVDMREDLDEKGQTSFDDMWQALRAADYPEVWKKFVESNDLDRPLLPHTRLAILARQRIDNGDLTITEQLINKTTAHSIATGTNVGHLALPFLMEKIEQEFPGPAVTLSRARQRGYLIHDMVYNRAQRICIERRFNSGAIAICQQAAKENKGNMLYSERNFVNMLIACVACVAIRELTSLLSKMIEQNPVWIRTAIFKNRYNFAMKLMADRVVRKELNPNDHVKARECREALALMAYARKMVQFDLARKQQTALDQAEQEWLKVAEDQLDEDQFEADLASMREGEIPSGLESFSRSQIKQIAVADVDRTWLRDEDRPIRADVAFGVVDIKIDDATPEGLESTDASEEVPPNDNEEVLANDDEVDAKPEEVEIISATEDHLFGDQEVWVPDAAPKAPVSTFVDEDFLPNDNEVESKKAAESITVNENALLAAIRGESTPGKDEPTPPKKGPQSTTASIDQMLAGRRVDRAADQPESLWGRRASKSSFAAFDKMSAGKRGDRAADRSEPTRGRRESQASFAAFDKMATARRVDQAIDHSDPTWGLDRPETARNSSSNPEGKSRKKSSSKPKGKNKKKMEDPGRSSFGAFDKMAAARREDTAANAESTW